ncbi:MAG: hypothetical protein ACXVQQ_00635 [Gaiellaceae bacterium]
MPSLVEVIAGDARSESEVWGSALRDAPDWEAVFSPLVPARLALGLETVYEAYLVHYGRPRLFEPPDTDEAILLGDYLYAHGLVRIADAGGVPAVAVMAELIARCAAERADGRGDDGAAWIAAARALGGDPDDAAVTRALATHSARVAP